MAIVALWACAPTTTPLQQHLNTVTQGGDLASLGSVDGDAIPPDAMPPETQRALARLAEDYAQRRYQLMWIGVEEAIASRLLEVEARRRDTDVAHLLVAEVDSQVGAPSDAEIRDLYEANQKTIGVPLADAAPRLKAQWQEDRTTQLRQALVDRLRQGAQVRYELPPPALPRVAMTPDAAPARGPEAAPVTIVEFADFQCPYSAQAWRLLHRLEALYPGAVRVVYQPHPLRQHARSQAAAEAAQCADEQARFWPYHDLLFANGQALEPDDLQRYASQSELDTEAFGRCMESERPKQAVARAQAMARRLGVAGTPVLFVNGMRLAGVLPLPLMQAIIDRELSGYTAG